jgi:hypothetical protein
MEDKIFPIMRKFDVVWQHNKSKTFCEVFNMITENKQVCDVELLAKLTEHIEVNKIKL